MSALGLVVLAADGVTLDVNYAAKPLHMMVVLGLLGLLPFAVMMLTSFAKFSVILSITRTALGSPSLPPTTVLTGLAAILSIPVMAPVAEQAYARGRAVYAAERSDADSLILVAKASWEPIQTFLLKHGHPEDRALFAQLGRELRPPEQADAVGEEDVAVLIPAFVVGELKGAFEAGFLIFLPFLVVDMLTANVLVALGMSSLNPTQLSLPFKLLLFVLVDGWHLLARGLVLGYR
jgi:type III secretion protein R